MVESFIMAKLSCAVRGRRLAQAAARVIIRASVNKMTAFVMEDCGG